MSNPRLLIRPGLSAVSLATLLAVPGVAGTVSWVNPDGGNWSTPANWNTGALPTAEDDVVITLPGTYSVHLDVHATVSRLTLGGTAGEPTLVAAGPTLTLGLASTVGPRGVLELDAGAIAGAGNLEVEGTLRIGGGALYGTVSVASSGTCELIGTAERYLVGSLINGGRVVWSGANNLGMLGDARFENLATGTVEIRNDQLLTRPSGNPVLVNAGQIRKTAGTGSTTLLVPVLNTGTIEVQTGVMVYAMSSVFGSGSTFRGAGASRLVADGVTTLDGVIHTENLEFAGGSTTVAGTNTIHGKLSWSRGWIGSSAVVTIASDGVLSLVGDENKGLGGILNNDGQVTWAGAGQIWQNAGQFRNNAGGVFELQTDAAMVLAGGTPTNTNAGHLLKSSGAGTTGLNVPWVNSGLCEVRTGTIRYAAGSVFIGGSRFTGAGVNLLSVDGFITLDGPIHSENLELNGGATKLVGTNRLEGVLNWTSGWLWDGADVTLSAGSVLRAVGSENKGLGGILRNRGQVVWSGGGQIWQNAGRFDNEPGAVLEVQTDAGMLVVGGTPTNTNAGLILKSAGDGTAFLGVPLVNTGRLKVDAGVLLYAAGSVFGSGSSFEGAGVNLLGVGGTITLDGAIHSQNLELGGGVTSISGTSTIEGTMAWTRGWIGATAEVTIGPAGVLNLTGGDNKGLAGILRNQGRVVWSGGGQLWQNAGELDNQVGGLFEIQTDSVMLTVGGTPTNHNAGRIAKSGGVGITFLTVPLVNSGRLEAQTGAISYAAGSRFTTGSRFTGSGTNLLAAGGVMTLEGWISTDNLQLGGPQTTLAGTNTIDGTLAWTSGWIGSAASVTVDAQSVLTLQGPVDKGLAGVLNNLGRVVWSDSGQIAMGGGTLNNLAGGLLDAQNDRAIYHYNGPVGTVHNAGVFRKSAAGVTTVVSIPFENTGTVDVQTGTVLFACPYTQTGGRLNLGLNSPTDCGRVQFADIAPLTGTLAANVNGDFRPRVGDSFTVVRYTARDGAFASFDLPTSAAWVTDETIYRASDVTLTVLNARPIIAAIEDRSLDEETQLTVTPALNHPDPGQTVTFALTQAPPGARIDSSSGAVTWIPTEAQGPSTNTITIQATDNGTPPLSDARTFTAVVREVNQPPHWTAPASLTQDELSPLQIAAVATDPDLPANPLSFVLVSGPDGATVDPKTGQLAWTPTESQGPGDYVLTVVVNDNGEPPLSITNQIAITVREVNTPPLLTVPDPQTLDELTTLVVTNLVTDTDLPANTLTFSLVSAPANVHLDPITGVVTWTPTEAQGPTNAAIRVMVTDNGSPPMSDTKEFSVTVREVNLAPTLAPIPDQVILAGDSLILTNAATDPDLPANSLRFTLISPPPGFTLDPVSGILTWTPLAGQVPSTNLITVRVTDDGIPSQTDQRTFSAAVVPVPSLLVLAQGQEVRISWSGAAPGFALQSAVDLAPPVQWTDATNVVGEIGGDRVVTNLVGAAPRFYRLRRP